MALTTGPANSYRRVSVWHFARLKLRILANGLRGRASRVVVFIVGVIAGLYLSGIGFLLLAASTAGGAEVRLMVASFGGALLVLGSVLLPLIWFGIDDTLDPARMALLPLPRRRLVAGLLTGALLGVPAAALLLATAGLLVPAAAHGGWPAALVQAVGLFGGLLLCVAAGQAATSAFATMLRSRRVRDLAGILLACLAALIAPLQLAVFSAAQSADWERLTTAARVVGWTPFGAPYTAGFEMAEGVPLAAAAKLAITAGAVAALLWWWSRSLESAMVGAASRGPGRGVKPVRGRPVALLLPRAAPGLPATAFGAIVARELRYWWRDAKRRANLITIAVVGAFAPVIIITGGAVMEIGASEGKLSIPHTASPALVNVTALLVGAFAASVLANQFGFDGSSYAAHLTMGVPGRLELTARATAYSIYLVPLLVTIGVALAAAFGDPSVAPAAWGLLFAGYGAGLAVNMYVSIVGAYPLPESANPFAIHTGSGIIKSLLALVAIVAAYGLAAPVLVAAALLGEGTWPWVALPVGVGYGLGAAALGSYLAGGVLDRRTPELLATISPPASI